MHIILKLFYFCVVMHSFNVSIYSLYIPKKLICFFFTFTIKASKYTLLSQRISIEGKIFVTFDHIFVLKHFENSEV